MPALRYSKRLLATGHTFCFLTQFLNIFEQKRKAEDSSMFDFTCTLEEKLHIFWFKECVSVELRKRTTFFQRLMETPIRGMHRAKLHWKPACIFSSDSLQLLHCRRSSKNRHPPGTGTHQFLPVFVLRKS